MNKGNNIEFAWVQWTVHDIEKVSSDIFLEKRRIYREVKNLPTEKRTFENTIEALEKSDEYLSDTLNRINFLMYVSPSKEVRDKAQEVSIRIEKESFDIEYDKDIYRAFLEYAKGRHKLDNVSKKLIADYEKSFKKRGFHLDDRKFKKLLVNNKKLSELSSVFSKNINEYQDKILISEDELVGLPETYKQNLKKKGKKYVITMSYPDFFPFVEYSPLEDRRKEITAKYFRRAGVKNLLVMQRILKLRYDNAHLLGFKNPAEVILQTRMAKSPKNVSVFLNTLALKIKKLAKKDIDKLRNEKRNYLKNKKAKLFTHDISFYSRVLRERTLGIDKEEIKKHLPFDMVKVGVFNVYSRLFSIKFVREKLPVWHKCVESYSIRNMKGEVMAYFYMDMFPRTGKYGHAAQFGLTSGRATVGGYKKPIVALVMNVPEPTAKQISLLSHGEAETFFHEFGHVMHSTLTRARFMSHSGTSVAGDFVEAPSQIFENWVWQPSILRKATRHYQTGRPLSLDNINKLIKAKNFLRAYAIARQLQFALFDMDIHTKLPKSINDVFNKYYQKLVGIPLPEGSIFPAAFGHFDGYGAGYYGYLWSQVYAADMFSRFQKGGILNRKIGASYQKEILEQGSGREELLSVKKFLGRSPNQKAFLKELGI